MRIDLNAKVRTRDGADVGHITQVIFDAEKREVTGVAVNDVLLPRADIERAEQNGNVVVLQLDKSQFERLERFSPVDYQPAPVGWMPPAGGVAWGVPTEAYLWAIPVGQPLPPHLQKGSPVVDRDGDEVGVVEDVEIAPMTGQVERFTVKLGGTLARLFGQAKEIELLPTDVQQIENGEVRLARDKEDLVPS